MSSHIRDEFFHCWLVWYPCPMDCFHIKGGLFIEDTFQWLLTTSSYKWNAHYWITYRLIWTYEHFLCHSVSIIWTVTILVVTMSFHFPWWRQGAPPYVFEAFQVFLHGFLGIMTSNGSDFNHLIQLWLSTLIIYNDLDLFLFLLHGRI